MLPLEIDILMEIELKLDEHVASGCPRPAYLILLNPGNFELLGWDEVLGLPVLPAEGLEPMRCRVVCGKKGWAGEFRGQPIYWIDGLPHILDAPLPIAA